MRLVNPIFPLKAAVTFDDREYRLGDPIAVLVEVTPTSDVELREGRVELLCRERWMETHSFKVDSASIPSRGEAGGMRVGRLPLARFDVPGRTVKRFARRYVHAAQSFLEGLTLRAGRPHRFDLTLRPTRELLSIDEMRGRRNPDRRLSDYRVDLGEHRASWKLRTVIDVALARDITVQHDVAVTVD